MKIVVNRCWGGFDLSHKAIMRYAELKGMKLYPFVEKRDEKGNLDFHHFRPYKGESGKTKDYLIIHYATKPLNSDGMYEEDSYKYFDNIERNDPDLLKVIKELGKDANGEFAQLEIREIPDGIEYEIDDYDGMETIHEAHRSW